MEIIKTELLRLTGHQTELAHVYVRSFPIATRARSKASPVMSSERWDSFVIYLFDLFSITRPTKEKKKKRQDVMQIETTTNGGQHGRCKYKRQTQASLWHEQFEFTARNRNRKRRKENFHYKNKEETRPRRKNSNAPKMVMRRNWRDQRNRRFDSAVEHFLASDEHSPAEVSNSLVLTTPH